MIIGVRKLGELNMDFSGLRSNKGKKSRKNPDITNDTPREQKVRIGQMVQTDQGLVEFVAMLGKNNRTVGTNNFDYADAEDPEEW